MRSVRMRSTLSVRSALVRSTLSVRSTPLVRSTSDAPHHRDVRAP